MRRAAEIAAVRVETHGRVPQGSADLLRLASSTGPQAATG